MSADISPAAPAALRQYYRILSGGSAAYGRGERLRPVLSEHLDFTGTLAGHRPDATDQFLMGVAGFIATASNITFVREVHADGSSAVLYDADLPGGTVRFAEFMTFSEGRIDSIALHFNGQDYLDKGGR